MRTTRFIVPLVALALCVMPAAALASSGGTTQAIVKDVAKDGKVDGHYTSAQLKAALESPLLKQYGGQGAVESVLTTSKPKRRPDARSGDGQRRQPAVHGRRRVPLRRRRRRPARSRPRAPALRPARRRGLGLVQPVCSWPGRRPRRPRGAAAGAVFRASEQRGRAASRGFVQSPWVCVRRAGTSSWWYGLERLSACPITFLLAMWKRAISQRVERERGAICRAVREDAGGGAADVLDADRGVVEPDGVAAADLSGTSW